MRILLASSEAVPFAKTGGLADVCGTLPYALAELGHEVGVIIPAYRAVWCAGKPIRSLALEFIVPVGSKTVSGQLLEWPGEVPGVTYYFVRQDYYYDRDELYTVHGQDYADNCERFVFFCRAVMEAARLLDFRPDILHANDWQTGLVPVYRRTLYAHAPEFQRTACVFTVHNMAFQGEFWHWDMLLTGLDWSYFNWQQMEFYGKLNFLKCGFVFSDAINTVSPRYAEEIQTPQFGCGLDGVLRSRRDVLRGILNGIDYSVWNPATDPEIARNYDADTVREGKPRCKAALQAEMGLPDDPRTPLVGIVSRLTYQKGSDLLTGVLPHWLAGENAQWVILGKGEPAVEQQLLDLARAYPNKLCVRLEHSEALARRIQAGADMFLMPSRFEPCGLTQLQALKYGTVPVVREIGGLADTITDYTPETLADGSANGFRFSGEDGESLSAVLRRACEVYHDPDTWYRLVRNGMLQDWSWRRTAPQYESMYRETLRRLYPDADGR